MALEGNHSRSSPAVHSCHTPARSSGSLSTCADMGIHSVFYHNRLVLRCRDVGGRYNHERVRLWWPGLFSSDYRRSPAGRTRSARDRAACLRIGGEKSGPFSIYIGGFDPSALRTREAWLSVALRGGLDWDGGQPPDHIPPIHRYFISR